MYDQGTTRPGALLSMGVTWEMATDILGSSGGDDGMKKQEQHNTTKLIKWTISQINQNHNQIPLNPESLY